MRYVELYTGFLVYCSEKLNRPLDALVYDFRRNGIEDEFIELYKKGSCSSYKDYFIALGAGKNGIKRFTKAKKNN